MTKIVINNCYGGFGLSETGMQAYAARKGLTLYPEKEVRFTRYWTVPPEQRVAQVRNEQWAKMSKTDRAEHDKMYASQIIDDVYFSREDPDLVAVVEELGEQVNGPYANLKVVEIPDSVFYVIVNCDGLEHVAEVHRIWS